MLANDYKDNVYMSSLINLCYCHGMEEPETGFYSINTWALELGWACQCSLCLHTQEQFYDNYTWSFLTNSRQFAPFGDQIDLRYFFCHTVLLDFCVSVATYLQKLCEDRLCLRDVEEKL